MYIMSFRTRIGASSRAAWVHVRWKQHPAWDQSRGDRLHLRCTPSHECDVRAEPHVHPRHLMCLMRPTVCRQPSLHPHPKNRLVPRQWREDAQYRVDVRNHAILVPALPQGRRWGFRSASQQGSGRSYGCPCVRARSERQRRESPSCRHHPTAPDPQRLFCPRDVILTHPADFCRHFSSDSTS